MRIAVICTLAVCAAAGIYAQTSLSLSDAIRQALAANPQLTASAERINVSSGLRTQAALAPNPRLFLQSENTRLGSFGNPFNYSRDADTFLYMSQVFESSVKRERRTDLAQTGIRRAELDRELIQRQVATRVALAYWAAAGAGRLRDLHNQNVTNFERIVEYHRNRVKEGAMPEVDLIRILLERERMILSAQTAAAEADRARINLFREMGRNDYPAVTLSQPLDAATDVPAPDLASALENRLEVRVARHAIEQARANVRLQHANASPDPELLFGYKRTAGFNTVMGGFQINLPFRNRNQGSIAAAEAEARAADATATAAEVQVRAEIAAALSDYENRRTQINSTLRSMRERAGEAARISDAAYREGGTDLLRLLDAQRLRLETESLYYRALAEFQQSVTTLKYSLGLMP